MDPTLALQAFSNGLLLSGMYILVALGLTLVFSILGIINFAHGELYMLGAYGCYVLYAVWGLNYALTFLIVTALVGLIGLCMERCFFRPMANDGLKCLVMSLALSIMLQDGAKMVWGAEELKVPSVFHGVVSLGGVVLSRERLITAAAALLLLAGLYLFVYFTKPGLAIRAVSQDPEAAALQGIARNRVIATTFCVGAALAGAAGVLVAPIFFVSPFMGQVPVMKAFAVIILGGLGSIPGVVLGGLLLGLAESVMATFLGSVAEMLAFGIIVLMLLVRPKGLLGHE